jgi:lysophospholipase L1-like esterase
MAFTQIAVPRGRRLHSKPWPLPVKALLALIGLLVLAELGLRLAGAVSFPLYDANTRIGYIPAANQSGSYLWTHGYSLNERHMAGGPLVDTAARKVLLVGDSVVWGGNPYRESDRLVHALQERLPEAKVWSLAAGGWAIRNQLAWLEDNADVVNRMNDVVLVINSTDLVPEAAMWGCETTHPTQRPWLGIAYYFDKVLKRQDCSEGKPGLTIPPGDWQGRLRQWIAQTQAAGVRVQFVLYPSRAELDAGGAKALMTETMAQLQATHRVAATEVARFPAWQPSHYKDAIHPTAEGNHALAEVLRQVLTAPPAGPSTDPSTASSGHTGG